MKAKDDDLKKLIIKLDELGLDFKITVLYDGYVCEGRVHDKKIVMIIPFEKNGFRNFMRMEIYEEKEDLFVPIFNELMEYQPFCKYQKGKIIVYEWNRNNQEGRYNELIRISNKNKTDGISRLERL